MIDSRVRNPHERGNTAGDDRSDKCPTTMARCVDNHRMSTESHLRKTRPGDHRAIPCERARWPYAGRTVFVPNPQHLLLTLFFETSMYEEKCRL